VTDNSDPPRPRLVDVADSYNRGVDAYQALWSPVILPPAADLVRKLGLRDARLVVDVGAGTGALLDAIRSAAPAARAVAVDASEQMLKVALARHAAAVIADAMAIPLADACTDAVILAYVLFHLADPARALHEAARVVRAGGQVGAITWAWERVPRAHAVWEEILTRAGVPPGPIRSADTGLDHPDALAATLRSAGLRPARIWPRRLSRQWDRSSYLRLVVGGGASRVRLSRVDAATRTDVLERLERAVERLPPDDLLFEGEVLCAIATR
jgi:SAM-dependent methyltransferase